MRLNVVEHLRPKGSSLFRRDRRRDQSSVHHLHQIVVHQVLVRRLDYDRRLAGFLKLLVRLLQVVVIRGKRIDINLFATQVRESGERGGARSSDDDLGYVGLDRCRESDSLFSVGRDDDSVGNHVSQPLCQGRFKLVHSHGKKCDFHLQLAGLQLLVGELLELFQCLVHHASGLPFVVEKTDGVEDDQGTDVAPLRHLIEVAGVTPETGR